MEKLRDFGQWLRGEGARVDRELQAVEAVALEALADGHPAIAGGSYFVNDMENAYVGGVSLQPVARTATANGVGVDLSSGDGQAFAIVVGGSYTDGTHAITLQESKNDNAASEHEAADAYAALTDTVSITNITGTSLQIVAFRHRKPWVRAVATVTGSPSTGAVYAVAICAPARQV